MDGSYKLTYPLAILTQREAAKSQDVGKLHVKSCIN